MSDGEHSPGPSSGQTLLVYRYTVTGSDKASIDTGVDPPDAGSNVWTNGDLLEIFLIAQTDAAGAGGEVLITLNNDTGSNYDLLNLSANNTSVTAAAGLATANWDLFGHGHGGSSSYPAMYNFMFPDYAGTTFWKQGTCFYGSVDATAANTRVEPKAVGYRSTSAISRFKVLAASSGNLKVGSQLLIYKRIS